MRSLWCRVRGFQDSFLTSTKQGSGSPRTEGLCTSWGEMDLMDSHAQNSYFETLMETRSPEKPLWGFCRMCSSFYQGVRNTLRPQTSNSRCCSVEQCGVSPYSSFTRAGRRKKASGPRSEGSEQTSWCRNRRFSEEALPGGL